MKENSVSSGYSRYVLALLLAVNLLNYIDRQVLYAVFPLVKSDLGLSDTKLGILGSAFMICYTVSAPFLGWIGDRVNRARLASSGLAIWSIATVSAGLARSYRPLLSARTAVGIGEASFGTVSPVLVSGFFPKEKRGRVLSYFYLAIPVGSALGYLLGGILGQRFGWNSAFLVVGAPGLLLALPLWFLRDSGTDSPVQARPHSGGFRSLFTNRSFVTNTLAMAAMTFALGGLAQWMPSFLHRVHSLDVEKGNTFFGLITVLSGITGTLSGGLLGDWLQKRTVKGYLIVSCWGFLAGAPITVYALMTPSLTGCLIAIFFAEFFLFLNTGPLNTIIVNITAPGIRALSFAVNIFFIHTLGDAISPAILGRLSDMWGLQNALLITPAAIVIAAAFCFLCMRFIGADSKN